MIAEKQFLVHSLKLPYELCDEINAYVFYDKHAAEVRNRFRKTCKKEMDDAYSNRRRGGYVSIEFAFSTGTIAFRGETEEWAYNTNRLTEIYDEETNKAEIIDWIFEICAVNCRVCGNYLMTNKPITNHNIRLRCLCNRNVAFSVLINDWTWNYDIEMANNALQQI